jgi:hypothetical protein
VGAAAQEEIASDLALDGQLAGEQEKPIDWNKVLREVRAAGVKAVGDELAETDIERLWHAAEGPYAPLAAPATVILLTDRRADAKDGLGSDRPVPGGGPLRGSRAG